jgi:hypothetical protein
MVSCDAVIDAPLARIQENEVRNSQKRRLVSDQHSKFTSDDSVLGYDERPQQAYTLSFLGFGTLFHKVIVAQLSSSRNTVFAEVL